MTKSPQWCKQYSFLTLWGEPTQVITCSCYVCALSFLRQDSPQFVLWIHFNIYLPDYHLPFGRWMQCTMPFMGWVVLSAPRFGLDEASSLLKPNHSGSADTNICYATASYLVAMLTFSCSVHGWMARSLMCILGKPALYQGWYHSGSGSSYHVPPLAARCGTQTASLATSCIHGTRKDISLMRHRLAYWVAPLPHHTPLSCTFLPDIVAS